MLHRADFLYTDDGMVSSTDPDWMQGVLDTLAEFFYRVGLRTNFGKTVRMLCRPCSTVGAQSEASYERRMTG